MEKVIADLDRVDEVEAPDAQKAIETPKVFPGKGSERGAASENIPLRVYGIGLAPSPCVDCGELTWNFCDGHNDDCFASQRVPNGIWGENQRTPFCTICERALDQCIYCRNDPPSAYLDELAAARGPQ